DRSGLHKPPAIGMDSSLRACFKMQQPLKTMMAFASVTGFLVFLFGLQAFVQPAQENQLPNFDQRRQAPVPQKPLSPLKAAAMEKLKSRIPGLRVEHDGLLQTPKHLASTAGFLSGPNGEGRGISAPAARAWPANDPH